MRNLLEKFVRISDSARLKFLSKSFINLISRQNYAHSLTWCGVQIFQTPTDIFLYQQVIFQNRPTVIIETGVAKGGSVLLASQLLNLIHQDSEWKIICCDVNSLESAKDVIYQFGYQDNVLFFQGDSASPEFKVFVENSLTRLSDEKVMLSLDSNHTEEHVLAELNSLGEFVSSGCHAIVWDSRIGDLSKLTHFLRPRLWNRSRHAGTGAIKFMNDRGLTLGFVYDSTFEKALLFSGIHKGVLRRAPDFTL